MQNRTSFQLDWQSDDGETTVWANRLANGGRITVAHRMTGFGWRDQETGYRSPCGQFWLASGGYDITTKLHELDSEDAMAEWVISRANTCVGGHPERSVGIPHARLMHYANWKPAARGGEGEATKPERDGRGNG